MMNILGLSLVVTSLVSAGIFSPCPSESESAESQQKQGARTIVKEGHRVVVVEYDQDGPQNTKISISPVLDDDDDAKVDKMREAASARSVLPNLEQGISQQPQDVQTTFLHAPKELICDVYGKCKHKIADAREDLQKKKEAVAEAFVNTKETVETAKNDVAANVSYVKDAFKRAVFQHVETLNSFMGVANLLGFSSAYGMCVWVTFISSYVQSRAMPRQQFAVVQSKIYPVYFRAMTYSIGVAFMGHVLGHGHGHTKRLPQILQAYNLLASLVTLFVNALYLEPRATKLMLERIKIEKEEGRGREDMSMQRTADPKDQDDAVRSRIMKLNDKLKKFNSYSSFLNILNLMSLTWHLVYLAQRLHHTC